jgi:predicted MFS family arabinose efflux permease
MSRIKYIAAFGIFGIITTEFGVIGILPQLAQYYNRSIEKTGILLSAFALVIALFGPWITLLLGRYNRKKLMLLTIALFIISNGISAMDPPFQILLLARILPAFLHPLYFSIAMAAAADTASPGQEHKAMSIIFGGVSLATVVGVPFATYMADLFGWQASFLVSGAVNMLAWLIILFFIPSMPVAKPPSHGKQLQILINPSFLLSAASVVLLLAAMFSIYSYFADYLQKVNGMNGAQISVMLMVFGIAGVAGNWIAGKLLSRNVMLTTTLFLTGLSIIYCLLYFTRVRFTGSGPSGSGLPGSGLAGSSSILMDSWGTIALIAVWGFVHTGCFLISQTWISMAAPKAKVFANSLGVSFGNLGLSMGTAISGWVIVSSGIHQVPWVSVTLVLASLILVFVKRKNLQD